MAHEPINLAEMLPRATITVSPEENPDQRAARLATEAAEHRFRMLKERVLFFAVLAGILTLSCLCIYEAIFDGAALPDAKQWARTALSVLFSSSLTLSPWTGDWGALEMRRSIALSPLRRLNARAGSKTPRARTDARPVRSLAEPHAAAGSTSSCRFRAAFPAKCPH
jgi:hypothetical protein